MPISGSDDASAELRQAYLHLLKRSLTDTMHEMSCEMSPNGVLLKHLTPTHPRWTGEDWPTLAETMAGVKRLECVQHCVERVLEDKVPGDFIETGVWRGGTTMFMRGLLKAYGIRDRSVYVADSFQGLPPPDMARYPQDEKIALHTVPYLAAPLEQVREGFSRYGLLDNQVVFIEGFFQITLPRLRDRTWSIVRLDGDMYGSTMDGLDNLYPGLSVGGYLILDDYYHVPESAQATDDYRARHGITDPIERVDKFSAVWRKAKPLPS